MIFGIGTDIVQISRIESLMKRYGDKFLKHIFTENERQAGLDLPVARRYAFFAKRFAAKEAFSKALRTGIGHKANWQDIEVKNISGGAPVLELSGIAKETLVQTAGINAKVHISLSDDEMAAATVIIES